VTQTQNPGRTHPPEIYRNPEAETQRVQQWQNPGEYMVRDPERIPNSIPESNPETQRTRVYMLAAGMLLAEYI